MTYNSLKQPAFPVPPCPFCGKNLRENLSIPDRWLCEGHVNIFWINSTQFDAIIYVYQFITGKYRCCQFTAIDIKTNKITEYYCIDDKPSYNFVGDTVEGTIPVFQTENEVENFLLLK